MHPRSRDTTQALNRRWRRRRLRSGRQSVSSTDIHRCMPRLTCRFRALRHSDGPEAPWSPSPVARRPSPVALLIWVADRIQKGCLQTKEIFRSQRQHTRGHRSTCLSIDAVVFIRCDASIHPEGEARPRLRYCRGDSTIVRYAEVRGPHGDERFFGKSVLRSFLV